MNSKIVLFNFDGYFVAAWLMPNPTVLNFFVVLMLSLVVFGAKKIPWLSA